MQKFNYYIVSKPIQYINVTNIPNFCECNGVLLLINSFNGAGEFYHWIINQEIWHYVFFANNDNEAYSYILKHRNTIDTLYAYSDCRISFQIMLYRLGNIPVFLYEEGFYSYQSFQDGKYVFLRKILFAFFNKTLSPFHCIGNCKKIKGIYVYRPTIYNRLKPLVPVKPLSFRTTLLEAINSNKGLSFFLYSHKECFKGKKILLHISGWKDNEKILSIFKRYPDCFRILKPHPRYNLSSVVKNRYDMIIPNKYMAEIIIQRALTEATKVIIVHENSTSIFNFIGNEKIEEINIGNKNDKYDLIYNEISKYGNI